MRTLLFPMSTRPSESRITSARSRPLSPLKMIPPPAAISNKVSVVRSSSPSRCPPALSHEFSAVSVSAGPNITDASASVSVTGHLIPQVDIGLSAFGGIASSTVFLNLDASIGLNVSANEDSWDGNDTGGVQACVDADTELAVNIGAQAAFFDLFSASTGKTIFDKTFPILQVRICLFRHPTRKPRR